MDGAFYVIVPAIMLAIACEFPFVRNKDRSGYELRDTLANIAMGLGMLGEKIIFSTILYFPYSFFYRFRIVDLPKSWWVYVILVFAEDYSYYWFHRVSHESRLFWCSHETHHSSERFNISTSVRQTWTGYFCSWIFWVPLLIIGFPPEWVVLQQSVSLFYQIFIHTEAVAHLGVFEKIMNTPSHHRVHHATNISYLDKNYAGIFIIWDRLHKTFAQEIKTPNYGTSEPLKSYNPLRIASHMWLKLARDVINAPGLTNKIKTIFLPPGWRFDGKGKTVREIQQNCGS